MNPSSSFRPLLPGAVLAFLAMSFAGWKIAAPAGGSTSDASSTRTAPVTPARQSGKRRPPSEAQEAMDAIRRSHSPLERARATIALANSLPASSFAAWVKGRWFNVRQGPELSIFTKILMERWKNEDPDGFLDWQMSSKSRDAIQSLSQLMKDSPEKALALIRKYPGSPAVSSALAALAETDPAAALKALCSLASRDPSANNLLDRGLLAKLAEKDPAALEDAISRLPAAYGTQINALIWNKRLSESFSDNLEKLWQRKDGFQIFSSTLNGRDALNPAFMDKLDAMPQTWKTQIAQNVYALVGQSNAEAWLQKDLAAAGFSKPLANRIQSTAVYQYGREHPEEAFAWVGGSDLSPSERQNFYGRILSRMDSQPEKQQQLLASIESADDRQAADKGLENYRPVAVSQQQPQSAPPVTPENFFDRVAANKPNDYSSLSQLGHQMGAWDEDQLSAVAAQFQALPEDRKLATSQALTRMNMGDSAGPSELKNQAFAYLVAHEDQAKGDTSGPYAGPLSGNVSQYAVSWSAKDPDAASAWVTTLPDGDTKTWAMKNLARNWQSYDPDAVNNWIGSLPAAQKTEVQKYLDSKK